MTNGVVCLNHFSRVGERLSSYEQLLLLFALPPLVRQCVHIGQAAHLQSLRNPGHRHRRNSYLSALSARQDCLCGSPRFIT